MLFGCCLVVVFWTVPPKTNYFLLTHLIGAGLQDQLAVVPRSNAEIRNLQEKGVTRSSSLLSVVYAYTPEHLTFGNLIWAAEVMEKLLFQRNAEQ
jgi:hypothetical protein